MAAAARARSAAASSTPSAASPGRPRFWSRARLAFIVSAGMSTFTSVPRSFRLYSMSRRRIGSCPWPVRMTLRASTAMAATSAWGRSVGNLVS